MSQRNRKFIYSLDLSFNDNAPDTIEPANSSLQYLKINTDNTVQTNSESPLTLVKEGVPQALRQVLSHFGMEDQNVTVKDISSSRGLVSKYNEVENCIANDITFSDFEKIQDDLAMNSTALATIASVNEKFVLKTNSSTDVFSASEKIINKSRPSCQNNVNYLNEKRLGVTSTSIDKNKLKSLVFNHSTNKMVNAANNSKSSEETNPTFSTENQKFIVKRRKQKQNGGKANHDSRNISNNSSNQFINKNLKVVSNHKNVSQFESSTNKEIRKKRKKLECQSKRIDNLSSSTNGLEKDYSFPEDRASKEYTERHVSKIEFKANEDSIHTENIPIVQGSDEILKSNPESNESSNSPSCLSRTEVNECFVHNESELVQKESNESLNSPCYPSETEVKECFVHSESKLIENEKVYDPLFLDDEKQISESDRIFFSNDNGDLTDAENKCIGYLEKMSSDSPLKIVGERHDEEPNSNIQAEGDHVFDGKIIEEENVPKRCDIDNKRIKIQHKGDLIESCMHHDEIKDTKNKCIGYLEKTSSDPPEQTVVESGDEEPNSNFQGKGDHEFNGKIIEEEKVPKRCDIDKQKIETQKNNHLLVSICKTQHPTRLEGNSEIVKSDLKLARIENDFRKNENISEENEDKVDANNGGEHRKISDVCEKMSSNYIEGCRGDILSAEEIELEIQKADINKIPENSEINSEENKTQFEKEKSSVEKQDDENFLSVELFLEIKGSQTEDKEKNVEKHKVADYDENFEHDLNVNTNSHSKRNSEDGKQLSEEISDCVPISDDKKHCNTERSFIKGTEHPDVDLNLDSNKDYLYLEESKIEKPKQSNDNADQHIAEEKRTCNIPVTDSEPSKIKTPKVRKVQNTKNIKEKILKVNESSSNNIKKSKKKTSVTRHRSPSKATLIQNLLQEKINIIEKSILKVDELIKKKLNNKSDNEVASEVKHIPDLHQTDYTECHGKRGGKKKLFRVDDTHLSDNSISLNNDSEITKKNNKRSNAHKTKSSTEEEIEEHVAMDEEEKSIFNESKTVGNETEHNNDRKKEGKNSQQHEKHFKLNEHYINECSAKKIHRVTDNSENEEVGSKKGKKLRMNKDNKNKDEPTENKIKKDTSSERHSQTEGKSNSRCKIQIDAHTSAILHSKIDSFLKNVTSEENNKTKKNKKNGPNSVISEDENSDIKVSNNEKHKQEINLKDLNSPTLIDGSIIDSERFNLEISESTDEEVHLENEYREMQSYSICSTNQSSSDKFSGKVDMKSSQKKVEKKLSSFHEIDEDSSKDQSDCIGKNLSILKIPDKNSSGKILKNYQKFSTTKMNSESQRELDGEINNSETLDKQMVKSTGVNSIMNPIIETKQSKSVHKKSSKSQVVDQSFGDFQSNQSTLPNNMDNSEIENLYLNDDMELDLELTTKSPIINSLSSQLKHNEEIEGAVVHTSTNSSNLLNTTKDPILLNTVEQSCDKKIISPTKNLPRKKLLARNKEVTEIQNKIENCITNESKKFEIDMTSEHHSENKDDFDHDIDELIYTDANSCYESRESSIEKENRLRLDEEFICSMTPKKSISGNSSGHASDKLESNVKSDESQLEIHGKKYPLLETNRTQFEEPKSPISCITKSVVIPKEKIKTHKEPKRKHSEYKGNTSSESDTKIEKYTDAKNTKDSVVNLKEKIKTHKEAETKHLPEFEGNTSSESDTKKRKFTVEKYTKCSVVNPKEKIRTHKKPKRKHSSEYEGNTYSESGTKKRKFTDSKNTKDSVVNPKEKIKTHKEPETKHSSEYEDNSSTESDTKERKFTDAKNTKDSVVNPKEKIKTHKKPKRIHSCEYEGNIYSESDTKKIQFIDAKNTKDSAVNPKEKIKTHKEPETEHSSEFEDNSSTESDTNEIKFTDAKNTKDSVVNPKEKIKTHKKPKKTHSSEYEGNTYSESETKKIKFIEAKNTKDSVVNPKEKIKTHKKPKKTHSSEYEGNTYSESETKKIKFTEEKNTKDSAVIPKEKIKTHKEPETKHSSEFEDKSSTESDTKERKFTDAKNTKDSVVNPKEKIKTHKKPKRTHSSEYEGNTYSESETKKIKFTDAKNTEDSAVISKEKIKTHKEPETKHSSEFEDNSSTESDTKERKFTDAKNTKDSVVNPKTHKEPETKHSSEFEDNSSTESDTKERKFTDAKNTKDSVVNPKEKIKTHKKPKRTHSSEYEGNTYSESETKKIKFTDAKNTKDSVVNLKEKIKTHKEAETKHSSEFEGSTSSESYTKKKKITDAKNTKVSAVNCKETIKTHKEPKRKHSSEYKGNTSSECDRKKRKFTDAKNSKENEKSNNRKKAKCRSITEYFTKRVKEDTISQNQSAIENQNYHSLSKELTGALDENSSHQETNKDKNYYTDNNKEFCEKPSKSKNCNDEGNHFYSYADILSQSHTERLENEFNNIREESKIHQDRENIKVRENMEPSPGGLLSKDVISSSREFEEQSPPKREISKNISERKLAKLFVLKDSKYEESLEKKKRDKKVVKLINKSKSIWEIQKELKIRKKSKLKKKIKNLVIENPYPLTEIQKIAPYIARNPTCEQKDRLQNAGIHLKLGTYSEEEDKKIMKNWKDFCELHNWDENDYSPFINCSKAKHGVLPLRQLVNFVKFISHGFEDRTMNSTYLRFIRMISRNEQSGRRFTKYEDKVIRKYVATSNSTKPFADVATILNKQRHNLIRRYLYLKEREELECPRITWNKTLTEKLLVVMAEITCCKNILELKNYNISLQEWTRVSKKMKIPARSIKRSWFINLYPRLFNEDFFENLEQTYSQLIEVLDKRYSCWRDVDWGIVAQEMGNELPRYKYNKMFRDLVKNKVPDKFRNNLKESLKFLRNVHLGTSRDNFRFVKQILEDTNNGSILPQLDDESSEEI